jgi:tetratricopeptide (TPR) repeat protein
VNEDYDNEIATLKEALKLKNDFDTQSKLIDAYLAKGQAAEKNGDKKTATECYDTAITSINEARKLEPSNDILLKTMIDLYIRTNRSKEAMPLMLEAIQKDPNNKIFQYNIGVLLMQMDSLKPAIGHFEEAVKIDPKYDVAIQNLAVAHMKLGDELKSVNQTKESKVKPFVAEFKAAASYFKQLIELNDANRKNADYWEYLASAYLNANMQAECKKALETAKELEKK